jgi:anthranilate phosphoribosyltransferase
MASVEITFADFLRSLVAGERLSVAQAEAAMEAIMAGEATQAQIAAMLVALRMRGEHAHEIAGFARAMRRHAVKVPVASPDVVDIVGTGGDAAETFNISTAAAFVAAGAGAVIAKHGNRSVTSKCGSADVLEELGISLTLAPEAVGRCIDEIGIGFMFAPAMHPAMRHAAPVRRELGLRTVFNLLGPLTNPAGARRQVLGVFGREWVRPLAEAMIELGIEHAMVVHGLDGLDELSTLGPTAVAEVHGGEIAEYTIAPEDVGLTRASVEELAGGDATQCATTLRALLQGQVGARRDIVLLNAAAALYVAGLAPDLSSGIVLAARSIDSGAAARKLAALRDLSQELTTED